LFWLKIFWIEDKLNHENIETALSILKKENLVVKWDQIVTVYWIERIWEIIPSIQVFTVD
jgi:hypothetical protein